MVNQEVCPTITKCRTCFNPTRTLHLLTKRIDGTPQQMSYADLLKDLIINIEDAKDSEMPQCICGSCSRKLMSSHAFIKQVREVHEKLWSMLNKPMDIDQKFESLDESKVDINKYLQINIESDGMLNGSSAKESTKAENEQQIKVEYLDISFEKHDASNDSGEFGSPLRFSGSEAEEDELSSTYNQNVQDKPPETTETVSSKKKKKPRKYEEDDDFVVLSCLHCNEEFTSSDELCQHMRIEHAAPKKDNKHKKSENKDATVPKARPHQCDKCPRKYTEKKGLDQHIQKQHVGEKVPKFKKPKVRPLCIICGKSCSNQRVLTEHIGRVHTGERPFECDICHKGCFGLYELKCHQRIHTGEKPYKCKICVMCFRTSVLLSSHMRSHSDDRPYKCIECGSSFKRSHTLVTHKRIHTGERPYSCTDCGKTFKQKKSVKIHRRKTGHMDNTT